MGLSELAAGVRAWDRSALGRAITLVESRDESDKSKAAKLLAELLPFSGKSLRIGITGTPGAGKSTIIDAIGTRLTARAKKIAVLAVDPSSERSGGSIMGDKTRMVNLAADDNAFIRPSPSGGYLGGVARRTGEAMIVLEAAGADVVIVETVGAGQSETMVAEMVDFFLVLMLAGAGDELQGIKKGALELADMIVINKQDRDPKAAIQAVRDFKSALHIITPANAQWQPPVLAVSALEGDGLDDLWARIEDHARIMDQSGGRDERREGQSVRWMWRLIEDRLTDALRSDSGVSADLVGIEKTVREGKITPAAAAEKILTTFWQKGS